MPTFHIVGNFTDGDGSQPVSVNDVSSIIQWMGVWHGAGLHVSSLHLLGNDCMQLISLAHASVLSLMQCSTSLVSVAGLIR